MGWNSTPRATINYRVNRASRRISGELKKDVLGSRELVDMTSVRRK
jgi:hypothetical protein